MSKNSDEPKWEVIPIPKVYSQLKHDISIFTSDYTLVMQGHEKNDAPITGAYGCGVFARINGVYGMITAKHVWDAFRNEMNHKLTQISMPIFAYASKLIFPAQWIRPYYPKKDNVDICFLKLPDPFLPTIKSRKSFKEICPERMPVFKEIKEFMMVSVGFPYIIQPNGQGIFRPLHYFTECNRLSHVKHKSGFDEFRIDVCYLDKESEPPLTLQGISGGGIWAFRISVKANEKGEEVYLMNHSWKDSPLIGINYYQTSLRKGWRSIKAMGPTSIYKRLSEIVQPS